MKKLRCIGYMSTGSWNLRRFNSLLDLDSLRVKDRCLCGGDVQLCLLKIMFYLENVVEIIFSTIYVYKILREIWRFLVGRRCVVLVRTGLLVRCVLIRWQKTALWNRHCFPWGIFRGENSCVFLSNGVWLKDEWKGMRRWSVRFAPWRSTASRVAAW